MANIALAIFLILFGVMQLFDTSIPGWVAGFVAAIAGLVILVSGWRKAP